MQITYTLNEINQAASQLWRAVDNKKIIAFHGEMGAGKTTLIHALCEIKGVIDVVGSPTFSIINEYSFIENDERKRLFHVDLYRLNNEEEAIRAGVEDCLYSDDLCLVEWPERIPTLFPDEAIHVFIKPVNDDTRMLTIGDN